MRRIESTTECGRPTWAEVDLAAISDNYRTLRGLIVPNPEQNSRVIPVIKAEAYGHGMIPIGRRLAELGATMFAVGTVEEALRLRQAGITQDILVLNTNWSGQEAAAIENRLTLACDNPDRLRRLAAEAKSKSRTVPVHIKIDTGMGRLGVAWNAMAPLLDYLRSTSHVSVTGTFSHLSSADEADPGFTMQQADRFEQCLSGIREAGLSTGEVHIANSAGLLYHARLRRWSARTGIALYGYAPDPERSSGLLRPALSLKTRVIAIRQLQTGEPVGYNRRFTAPRPTRVAVIPIGYADGFNRHFTNKGKVIVGGRLAPVIGTVSMDLSAIDVTDMPNVQPGEETVLLGSASGKQISADDWARTLGTISYEVLCAIAPRVPRIYCEGENTSPASLQP